MNNVVKKEDAGLPAQVMFEEDAGKGIGDSRSRRLSITFS
jgi:hypothetical protein